MKQKSSIKQDSIKRQCLKRLKSLQDVRNSWDPQWRTIGRLMSSRLGRFSVEETNRGEVKHGDILDNVAFVSYRTLAQGMMSGMTSPARPWFKLTLSDDALADSSSVKEWLEEVTKRMRRVFQDSNTYRALHSMYEELALFGTAASFMVQDDEKVVRHYPLTIGEYWVSANHKGEIDTLYRRIQKTAYELVDEFGIENVSNAVQSAYERGSKDKPVVVVHAVEPNRSRDVSKHDAQNMAWRSVYFEENGEGDKLLRVSGFKRFPVLCARWAVTGNDVYGCSPGMDALGDVKQLYAMTEAHVVAVQRLVDPPLIISASFKDGDLDTNPGGRTRAKGMADAACVPINAGPINLDHLSRQIVLIKQSIREAFYVDMFLIISGNDNTQMTATEVAERREEKMMMLGPVVERLQSELLNPLIDLTFDYMAQAGRLPPVPEELFEQDYKVELVGMMAQSQQAIEANAVARLIGGTLEVARAKPEILDKIDLDALVDVQAHAYGVSPSIVRPTNEANKLRSQRAQAQQAMQQAAMQNQAADTAQKLASAKTDEDNLLAREMGQFSGY